MARRQEEARRYSENQPTKNEERKSKRRFMMK
jgi:hypothetical protein